VFNELSLFDVMLTVSNAAAVKVPNVVPSRITFKV
jgi:hypothetical protein